MSATMSGRPIYLDRVAMVDNLNDFRPRLMSVAYRMLGSVADAEDAVQDAYLRLQTAQRVTSLEGFLVTTTTRRCIDQLRAARRRKNYVGPWLPEPVDTSSGPANGIQSEALVESLSQGFLLLMERLAPTERAAFLLRSAFDYDYSEIAAILGKSEVHVRQMVSRAKSRIKHDTPRFHPNASDADSMAERFIAACRAGDTKLVEGLLTENAEVHSDGGGKVSAARTVIRGHARAARFLSGVFSKKRQDCEMHPAVVNGHPGVVFTSGGAVVQVVSLRIEGEVQAVYMTLNPDKLARWSLAQIG